MIEGWQGMAGGVILSNVTGNMQVQLTDIDSLHRHLLYTVNQQGLPYSALSVNSVK